jgi:hypothetical protein
MRAPEEILEQAEAMHDQTEGKPLRECIGIVIAEAQRGAYNEAIGAAANIKKSKAFVDFFPHMAESVNLVIKKEMKKLVPKILKKVGGTNVPKQKDSSPKRLKISLTEVRTILKSYCVLIEDSREQKNHISEKFSKERKGKKIVTTPLDFGDYTFMILPNKILGNKNPISFQNDFVIERKSGFLELAGNLTTGHQRLKNEFSRALTAKCNNLYLLIEDTNSFDDINNVKFSKLNPKTYRKILDSFLKNRNSERGDVGLDEIKVIMTNKEKSLNIIMEDFTSFFRKWVVGYLK